MSNKKQSVTAEDFVRAWQQSECVAEVVEKTSLNANTAVVRAVRYRKLGIPLKKFRDAAKRDVAALQQLAAELVRDST